MAEKMTYVTKVFEKGTNSTWETATEAIKVWKTRPNVVNRRLCGCSEVWNTAKKYESDTPKEKQATEFKSIIVEKINELFQGVTEKDQDCLHNILKLILFSSFVNFPEGNGNTSVVQNLEIEISFRKLLPRSLKKFRITVELAITFILRNVQQGSLHSYTTWFIPFKLLDDNSYTDGLPLPCFSYGLQYFQEELKKGRIELITTNQFDRGSVPVGTLCANLDWLADTLLPKLKNWSETFNTEELGNSESRLQSLALVNMEEYSKVYNEMKEKYAQSLIESWQENTDPQKFIFEDLSIASYLKVLWEDEQRAHNLEKKPSFVDLGCGNGLLVYLLTKEGYSGYGIDIRSRKIWDQYGDATKLMEQPLHPNQCKFDDVDWIIGNHSDELTPWIPLIAARSSYKTKYFLLPCCFHDFIGKFKQNSHDSSQYQAYLDYVAEIGKDCGFVIEHDIQRIPSTKRVCQIARKRTYEDSEQDNIDDALENVLSSRNCRLKLDVELSEEQHNQSGNYTKQSVSSTGNTTEDANEFKPRVSQEKIRNCTQIDKDIKSHITMTVFRKLLETEKSYGIDDGRLTSKGDHVATWNCGGTLAIGQATSLFDKACLQELKCQCGGLQTLLKNHGHIFQVFKGEVSLKNYKKACDSGNLRKKKGRKPMQKSTHKTKICWFHFNHPNGCILPSEDCRFAHCQAELRTFLTLNS